MLVAECCRPLSPVQHHMHAVLHALQVMHIVSVTGDLSLTCATTMLCLVLNLQNLHAAPPSHLSTIALS
jgi:hypothetical protein